MYYKREPCPECGVTVEYHRDPDGNELPQVGHRDGCSLDVKPPTEPVPDIGAPESPPDDQAA